MVDVVKKIYDLMEQRNWTTYELAKQSGLSQSTISSFFSRHTVPSIETLNSICEAFDISLSIFFYESDTESLSNEFVLKFSKLKKEDKKIIISLINRLS